MRDMGRLRMRFRRTTRGEPGLITWDDHPKRDEYRAANDGLGMCNTGSGLPVVCCLGGIGCNVDHLLVAQQNLAERDAIG